jgi:hypothetical protein
MKTPLILSFLLGIGLAGHAQSPDEQAVLDTENRRFAAQISKDTTVMRQTIADDLVYVHSNGNVDNKQTYIESIRSGRANYTGLTPGDRRVRVYGKTAIVTGIVAVTMNNNNQPTVFSLRYTDVYVRNGRQWQLVTWQSLRMTP